MLFIQFISFYSLIYFFGRGVVSSYCLIKKQKSSIMDSKILGIKISFYYPIFGLFVLGNLGLLVNFFSGINNTVTYSIVILIFLTNFFHLKKITFSNESVITFVVIPMILSITTIGMGLHTDSSLYHLSYQNWLRSEKIVIGLSNLHGRFGFSSIYDYISSFFWLENNFILLHFLNLVFFLILFNFLIINLLSDKKSFLFHSSLILVGFGLLDNVGFSGGRNGFIYIEGVGKQDAAYAVMLFITVSLFIKAFNDKFFSIENLIILTMMSLFTTQLRIMGLSLLIFEFLFIYNLVKKNQTSKIIFAVSPFIILAILWMLKNVIISGCIFYPIESTCFTKLSWYYHGQAAAESNSTSEFFYGLSTEDGIIQWYKHWFSSEFNKTLSYNFIISFIVILFGRFIFFKSSHVDKSIIVTSLVFIMINLYAWLINAPGIRFLMGCLMIIVSLLAVGEIELRFNNNFFNLIYNKIFLIILLLVCVALIPRTYQYSEFLNSPTQTVYIESKEVGLKKNSNYWGYVPEVGDECGININCIPYKKSVEESSTKYLQYKIYR